VLTVVALALPLLGTQCGAKVKKVTQLPAEQVLPLQTATLEELLGRLEELGTNVNTINAVTELVPSTGSAYSGVIEEYHDVRAFVLARRAAPAAGNGEEASAEETPRGRQVRLIGQAPIVRKDVFDMVADEERFEIYIPSKNKFIVGPTALARRSDNPIENLRPQHLFDALFLSPPQADAEHLLEENEFGGVRYYSVSEIIAGDAGLRLHRRWWFDRRSLELVRVQWFDARGQLLSDIHYSNWLNENSVSYPGIIELVRPHDDYRLKLIVKELKLNQPLPPKAFDLEKPANAEVVELKDEPKTPATEEQP
jgi:hypothetical protein